jgi:multicomponent K+:H+ antiporter subunit A
MAGLPTLRAAVQPGSRCDPSEPHTPVPGDTLPLLGLAVLLPLVVGTLGCVWIGRGNTPARRLGAALWAGAVTAASLAIVLSQADGVLAGQVLHAEAAWMPAIGLNLGLRLDGLALLFAGLISGMGLLIVLYAAYYLHPDEPAGKFFAQLLLFMAAMLGIVLADNLLLLVVFWELTSVSSFLLVGWWARSAEGGEAARRGARMALAVTGGGGLALLAGMLLLGDMAGTFSLQAIFSTPGLIAQVQADPRFGLMLGLVLVGCFTKSAQLPFHFWLPQAMAAPTPVSAYLHSATMVKAGLFLLLRLHPIVGGTALFEGIVAPVGLLTMVFAAGVAVFRHDLKALLAYSTVSHLGLVAFLIGLGSPLASGVALFHILNHACFKAALFMSAGIVDHETGTRDLRRLGGLVRFMPVMAALAAVAAAAMAGLPPFNGFISKELMLKASLADGSTLWPAVPWLMPALATLGGLFSVAYSARLVHDTFFNGQPRALPNAHPHEPPWGMKAPVVLLVALCVLLGLVPALLVGPLVQAAGTAALGRPAPPLDMALWHGLNLPLLMSAIAVFGGVALYARLMRGRRLHGFAGVGPAAHAVVDAAIDGLARLAAVLTRLLENGSLQRYAAWMLGSAVLLVLWALSSAPLEQGARSLIPATPVALALWLVLAAVCVMLVRSHHLRFRAVLLTGVIGLVVSLTFLAFSAPDLALTQLSVEVVSTVLLLMGLALLPPRTPVESSVPRKLRDGALALACGGGVAWIAWLVMTRDHDSIAWYFLENTISQGGGANAVNVILVDFRGYDTWGEITVLGIAAVGVLALLDGFTAPKRTADVQGRRWSFPAQPLMLQVVARLVLPLALVVSVYLYWRGHNLPGGGFIAGLVTASALVLQYMALGQAEADRVLRAAGGRRFTRWIALGLALACATGLGAFAFGFEFLTSHTRYVDLGVFGDVALATAALFDLGVYITVVGATMLTLTVLGNASKPQGAPA